jgi:hypothetical protein
MVIGGVAPVMHNLGHRLVAGKLEIVGQIVVVGFIMNLMTAVYNLMPFSPMGGKFIYDWSRLFWMLTFVPLALFFILMAIFFV